MPPVVIRTLGCLEIEIDGEARPDQLARSKQLALLIFLAADRPSESHRRESVMAVFWPESDETRARRSLRQAVYELRRDLGSEVLESPSPDTLALGAGVEVDVRQFWTLVEADRDEDALSLYRGDFLPGFHLRDDGDEFERWATRTRESLRSAALMAAARLRDSATGAGDLARAVEVAERAVELAPYDEATFRNLLFLLERIGDRSGAVKAYEEFASRLEADLELTPGPETRAVVRRLREPRSDRSGIRHADVTRPATLPVDTPGPTGTANPDESRASPGSGVRRRVATAALLLTVMVAAVAFVQLRGWADPVELDPSRILVTRFVDETSGEGGDVVARLAADWILEGLVETGLANVIAPVGPDEPLGTHADPSKAARSAGAGLALTGSVYSTGQRHSLQARLVNVRDGELLTAAAADWEPGDDVAEAIRGVRASLLAAVLERLEPSVATLGATHTDRPPTVESYRAFTEGLRIFSDGGHGYAESAPHFERSNSLDESFDLPLIWAALAHDGEDRMVGDRQPRHAAARDSLLASLEKRRDELTTLERRFLDYVRARVAEDSERAYLAATGLRELTTGPEYMKLAADVAHSQNRPQETVDLLMAADPDLDAVLADEGRAMALTQSLHQLGAFELELELARRSRAAQHPRAITPVFHESRALAALGRVEALDSLVAHMDDAMDPGFHRFHYARLIMEIGLELDAHGSPAASSFLERAILLGPPPGVSDELAAAIAARRHDVRLSAFLALERPADARVVADSLAAAMGPEVLAGLEARGLAAAAIGDRELALDMERRLAGFAPDGYGSRAAIRALLGDGVVAMRLLEEAINHGEPGWTLHRSPAFRGLRADTAFARLAAGDG